MKIKNSRMPQNPLNFCIVVLTAVLAWTSPVKAATINITASATIVSPVAFEEPSDMRFSGFTAGVTPGTITLVVPPALQEIPPTSANPITSGARLREGGVKLVRGTSCTARLNCGVGAVQISGPGSSAFNGISTTATTTLRSGDNTMTLDGIELRYGANGTAGAVRGPGILNSVGNGTILVGGVLNVAAGQAVGAYTGSLMISVDY